MVGTNQSVHESWPSTGCLGSSGTSPGWKRMAWLVAGVSRATRHAGALGRSWRYLRKSSKKSEKKGTKKGFHRKTIDIIV